MPIQLLSSLEKRKFQIFCETADLVYYYCYLHELREEDELPRLELLRMASGPSAEVALDLALEFEAQARGYIQGHS